MKYRMDRSASLVAAELTLALTLLAVTLVGLAVVVAL